MKKKFSISQTAIFSLALVVVFGLSLLTSCEFFQKTGLHLISGGEGLTIESLDGKAYISDAKKTFRYIDAYFENWRLNHSGPATAETIVDVNEIVKDGTFVQIFTEINSDLDKIAMTQAQIIRFCEKYPTWLSQGRYATFFLTKVDSKYFVIRVNRRDDALDVNVRKFEIIGAWNASYGRRIVSLQYE